MLIRSVFQQLEQRIAKIHDLATKHRISPAQLPQYYQQMKDELGQKENSDLHLARYRKKLKT